MGNKNENLEKKPERVMLTYSKFNPSVFNITNRSDKVNLAWTIIKYLTAAISAMFLILAMFFAAKWTGVTKDFEISTLKGTADVVIDAALVDKFKNLTIISLQTNFTEAMATSLIAFSILLIVFIFPVLINKNGSLYSAIAIILSWLFIIIVIALFSYGCNEIGENQYTYNGIRTIFFNGDLSVDEKITQITAILTAI